MCVVSPISAVKVSDGLVEEIVRHSGCEATNVSVPFIKPAGG